MSLENIAKRAGHTLAVALIASSTIVFSSLGSPAPARAACFTSSAGTNYPTSVWVTFDNCRAEVNVQLPICSVYPIPPRGCYVDHYNIGFGQRPKSDEGKGVIFSGQRERDGDKRFYLWGTRPRNIPVVAYFRVQSCGGTFIGPSSCDTWSDPVTIELGYNELKAR